MIERLLENWLTRANERSFQIPFCHWLAYKGHTVVHMSRHCAMEMGKDILAIDPEGIPCAYQLKGVESGGRITLSKWRDDLSKQLHPLVHRKIVHPSIPNHSHHRSFIVINGELDEVVARDIDDFNRANADSGLPDRKVEVILRGQLFQYFKELQSDFWATNLHDLQTYLELYLEDGKGQLPKAKVCKLFESALPFQSENQKQPSRAEIEKAAAGCAIICSAAISSFTMVENHVAEFEAWTIFWAHCLGLLAKWGLPPKQLSITLDLATEGMYTSLGRLCDELMKREDYIEGNPLSDRFVYEIRMTHLLGLMGIYGLWRLERVRKGIEEPDSERDEFLRSFCHEKVKLLNLWGEYAVPQWLSFIFYFRTINATCLSDHLYLRLIEAIIQRNGHKGPGSLANPYYDAEAILPYVFGLESEPLRDSFTKSSFMLEGLMHLYVRENYKLSMRALFPAITKIGFRSFEPDERWQFFLYRNDSGTNHDDKLNLPQKWSELKAMAAECDGKDVPELLRLSPILYLCFICVFPHRANSSGLRWVSTRLLETLKERDIG